MAGDDDWSQWEAELLDSPGPSSWDVDSEWERLADRRSSAPSGPYGVTVVGAGGIGSQVSRLIALTARSGLAVSAAVVTAFRDAESAHWADLSTLYLTGHGLTAEAWVDQTNDRGVFKECSLDHFWRIESIEQARTTPDDLAYAMQLARAENLSRFLLRESALSTSTFLAAGSSSHDPGISGRIDQGYSWLRVTAVLKFLLFCATRAVLRAPVGMSPEPSEPPGRLVASNRRPPRGPGHERELKDLLVAGELAPA